MKWRRILSVLPILDWYITIKYNPWGIPLGHRIVALLEHTFGYGLLGFISSFVFTFGYAILFFVVLAIVITPVEILLATKGIRPWFFLKDKDKMYISKLFLCMVVNVLFYYVIGGLFPLYLNI